MNSFIKKTYLVVFSFISFYSFAQDGLKVGSEAKDFKLKNVEGTMASLSDYKAAKGFIVVFTCNHCPYSKKYEQRIMDLDKKYASKGYPVIAINPNDSTEYKEDSYSNMIKHSKEKGYPFPYLYDESQEVAKHFGAQKTPHTYVLEKKAGKYIVKYIGAIDDNTNDASKVTQPYVEYAVNALLEDKKVAITETKAIGCGIKWKE